MIDAAVRAIVVVAAEAVGFGGAWRLLLPEAKVRRERIGFRKIAVAMKRRGRDVGSAGGESCARRSG